MNNPTSRPIYQQRHEKVETYAARRLLTLDLVENLFFGLATLFSFVIALLLLRQGVTRWSALSYLLVFWAVLAYLALPRLHRVLTAIYVPGYFIGRSRTTDGLLGDPINLAARGDAAQIHEAMQRAGWVLADPVDMASSVRIVSASVTRKSYPEAPVSPLMLFGRIQDFAYQQEVEGNPAQRHHVRFWRTPDDWLLPGGHRVDWLAAGTYDRSVGLSLFTLQVTHKIDRDIDIERDYIVDSLRYAVPEVSVEVIEDFSTGYHSRNGGGDAVTTDGDLPVVHFSGVPVESESPGSAPRTSEAAGAHSGEDLLHQVGRRPFSVVAAAVFTTISLVGSLTTGVSDLTSFDWAAEGVQADETPTLLVLLAGVITVTYAVMALLAWLTFRGRRWARLCMLALLTLSLINQVLGLSTERPTMSTLAALSLDMLTIYALTSLSAREWTRPRPSAGASPAPSARRTS